MLAVHCVDARELASLRAAVPSEMAIAATNSWSRFEAAAVACDCAVAVLPWLDHGSLFGQLRAVRERLPLQPFVLVTTSDPENLRFLKDIVVEEIVWTHDVNHDLWPAIGRARAVMLLRQTIAAFEAAEHISPRLRDALIHVFRSDPPLRSVNELAGIVGRDRRTLWRYWVDTFGRNASIGPGDLIDWLLLFRAASLKAPGRTWTAIAADFGIHVHTVSRIARRLTGLSLADIDARGQTYVARIFTKRVLVPILTASR